MSRHLLSRRNFLESGITAIATTYRLRDIVDKRTDYRIKAIAFDAFPIFDPRPAYEMASRLFKEKGNELATEWRTKQFEYTWLRAAARQYKDFWHVTKDALRFAANKINVRLSADDENTLMEQFLSLNAWPDVITSLEQLRQNGFVLAFLSNMTSEMLNLNMKHCGIEKYFDHVISSDQAQTYKPNPSAYELGTHTLKLRKEEILFVAFAGWDVCGAKWFGYRTFWLNRLSAPDEQLNAKADGAGSSMAALLDFIH